MSTVFLLSGKQCYEKDALLRIIMVTKKTKNKASLSREIRNEISVFEEYQMFALAMKFM